MARFVSRLTEVEMASQIAALLNAQNKLTVSHTADTVMAKSSDYFVELAENRVVGCIAISLETPSCSKITHLSVIPQYRRRGTARKLLERAMSVCFTRSLIMTIRDDNIPCIRLAESMGFNRYKTTKKERYSVITMIKVFNNVF